MYRSRTSNCNSGLLCVGNLVTYTVPWACVLHAGMPEPTPRVPCSRSRYYKALLNSQMQQWPPRRKVLWSERRRATTREVREGGAPRGFHTTRPPVAQRHLCTAWETAAGAPVRLSATVGIVRWSDWGPVLLVKISVNSSRAADGGYRDGCGVGRVDAACFGSTLSCAHFLFQGYWHTPAWDHLGSSTQERDRGKGE